MGSCYSFEMVCECVFATQYCQLMMANRVSYITIGTRGSIKLTFNVLGCFVSSSMFINDSFHDDVDLILTLHYLYTLHLHTYTPLSIEQGSIYQLSMKPHI